LNFNLTSLSILSRKERIPYCEIRYATFDYRWSLVVLLYTIKAGQKRILFSTLLQE